MSKRPSLFASKEQPQIREQPDAAEPQMPAQAPKSPRTSRLAATRAGKRALSVYIEPLAWKQLRQLALDKETTAQALTEEAINDLFAKYGLNRSA